VPEPTFGTLPEHGRRAVRRQVGRRRGGHATGRGLYQLLPVAGRSGGEPVTVRCSSRRPRRARPGAGSGRSRAVPLAERKWTGRCVRPGVLQPHVGRDRQGRVGATEGPAERPTSPSTFARIQRRSRPHRPSDKAFDAPPPRQEQSRHQRLSPSVPHLSSSAAGLELNGNTPHRPCPPRAAPVLRLVTDAFRTLDDSLMTA
jgi:hypothetical protein